MLRARPFKNTVKARAEQLVAGTGWLPEPLRIAINDNAPEGDPAEALAAE